MIANNGNLRYQKELKKKHCQRNICWIKSSTTTKSISYYILLYVTISIYYWPYISSSYPSPFLSRIPKNWLTSVLQENFESSPSMIFEKSQHHFWYKGGFKYTGTYISLYIFVYVCIYTLPKIWRKKLGNFMFKLSL